MAGQAGASQLPTVVAVVTLLLLGYLNIRGAELQGLGSSTHLLNSSEDPALSRSARERRLNEQHSYPGRRTAHIYVRSRHSSQIYVPCGLKFKPPKRNPEQMSHAEFFDYYKDVYKTEALRFNITRIVRSAFFPCSRWSFFRETVTDERIVVTLRR
jgi:hypothetical protein